MKCKNCGKSIEDDGWDGWIHSSDKYRCDGQYVNFSPTTTNKAVPDYFGAYLEEVNLLTSDTKSEESLS